MLLDVCKTTTSAGRDVNFDRWADSELSFDIPDVADSFNTDTIPYREAFKTHELEIARQEADGDRKRLIHEVLSLVEAEGSKDSVEKLAIEMRDMDYNEVVAKAYNIRRLLHAERSATNIMQYIGHLCTVYGCFQNWVESHMNGPVARVLGHLIDNFHKYEDRAHTIALRYYFRNYVEEDDVEESILSSIANLLMLITFGSSFQSFFGDGDAVDTPATQKLQLL